VVVNPLSVDQVTFRIFAALCAVLVLKNVALASLTGAVRIYRKAWGFKEDLRYFGGEVRTDELVERIRRAHGNALENDPLFMMVGLLYLLVGAPEGGIQAYGYTFVIARFVHAAALLLGMQPFRTLAFAGGLLAIVGMSVQVLMRAFA
jgi:glutathione S-transferase